MSKILIVDDVSGNRDILKAILSEDKQKYVITEAYSGQAALDAVDRDPPDIILLDIMMPEMDGFEVCRKLKSHKKYNSIPIIFVTALKDDTESIIMGLQLGGADYITKPVNPAVLKARIRVHLEIKYVIQALTESHEQLRQMTTQLIQAEKLSAIGQLASGVAHEVKNPLGIIRQCVGYLEKKVTTEKKVFRETLPMINESIDRADKIITSLLDFSRVTTLDLHPENINAIFENSFNLVKPKFEDIDLVKKIQKNLPMALVDKNKLEQVFINIFLNAAHAMNNKGTITARIYTKQFEEPKNGVGEGNGEFSKSRETSIAVEIEDAGIGISEEDIKKVFDPFFTTKTSIGGTGLGLLIAHNIIAMHKGRIDIASELGQGTKVTINLRIARKKNEKKENINH